MALCLRSAKGSGHVSIRAYTVASGSQLQNRVLGIDLDTPETRRKRSVAAADAKFACLGIG